MKTILLFFPNDICANTFMAIDAYRSLASTYEVHAVLYPLATGTDFDFSMFKSVTHLKPAPSRDRWRWYSLALSMWANRNEMELFEDSSRKVFWMELMHPPGVKNFAHNLLYYYIPGQSRRLANMVIRRIEQRLGHDNQVYDIIDRIRPDLVMSHGTGHESPDVDIIKASRAHNVPTLFLQATWDTYSNRGPFPYQPDFIGVWGYQSAIWVEKIQGIHRSRVFMLGATFAEAMKRMGEIESENEIKIKLGLPADKKVILFAGSARGGNEVGRLAKIEETIDKGFLNEYCVFYRPHPFRMGGVKEPSFFDQNFKHVILDPTLEERFRQFWTDEGIKPLPRKPSTFPRSFRHTYEIFSISSVAIAPITTYMLEALWFGLPCVEIGYVDTENKRFNIRYDIPSSAIFQCLPSVFVCTHPSQLIENMQSALKFGEDKQRVEVGRKYLGNVVYDDEMPFDERILNAADTILNRSTHSIHHYMNNPVINVDKQENVVED